MLFYFEINLIKKISSKFIFKFQPYNLPLQNNLLIIPYDNMIQYDIMIYFLLLCKLPIRI